jgi:hypothetical protein
MPQPAYGYLMQPFGMDDWAKFGMDDWTKSAPWMGTGLALLVASTWILRTAIVLHNKKIAADAEQEIAVPNWYYAACIVFVTLVFDALLGGGLATALGNHYPVEVVLVALALRLLVHPAVLSLLLAAHYRAAMAVQAFEIAIALTLAPVVGAVVAVIVAR